MTKQTVLKCPLCQGNGEVQFAALLERIGDQDVRLKIEHFLAEMRSRAPEPPVPAGSVVGKGPTTRDFEKEVHHWNPQLPIWRRSPKE